jgi:hypothetical protein
MVGGTIVVPRENKQATLIWPHPYPIPFLAHVPGGEERVILLFYSFTSAPELNWLPIDPRTGSRVQPQGKR